LVKSFEYAILDPSNLKFLQNRQIEGLKVDQNLPKNFQKKLKSFSLSNGNSKSIIFIGSSL